MDLRNVLAIEDDATRQATLKKAFMPYSENIEIDGYEREALTVLINLSAHHKLSPCKDLLDSDKAMDYLCQQSNISASIAEIKWFHTHNLKYPDCRPSNRGILGQPLSTDTALLSSSSLPLSLGWSHNAAAYRHTIWLLNSFCWQSQPINMMTLIQEKQPFWLDLFHTFGLSQKGLESLCDEANLQLNSETFPDQVNSFSKQLRFPWQGEYISITPVVSHAVMAELECRRRNKNSCLKFITYSLPNSASIGNLCASLGGHMNSLYYPADVASSTNAPLDSQTLASNRRKSSQYFNNYQMTNKRVCELLARLAGLEPLKTRKQRLKVRKEQIKLLRKQVALWLLPLIELRDRMDSDNRERVTFNSGSWVDDFLTLPESQLTSLIAEVNQHLHFTLQEDRFARKYAYHPNLTQVIKSQIRWVLKTLSLPSKEESAATEEQYIHLSSLRVQGANSMGCPYLCGIPSLTALWGFVHRYQREFNQLLGENKCCEFISFSLYLRSQRITTTAKLTEPNSLQQRRTVSNAKRPTILGEKQTDLELDLVIKVRSQFLISSALSELKSALPLSLAGGAVFQPSSHETVDWLQVYASQSSLFQYLKGQPAYGRWIYPNDWQPESFDDLELAIDESKNHLPVMIGYHFLEIPTLRAAALTHLHAYAESVLGIAKQVHPIEMRFLGRDHFFKQAFWSLECSSAAILIKNT